MLIAHNHDLERDERLEALEDFQQFLVVSAEQLKMTSAFESLDKDHNGNISLEEFTAAYCALSDDTGVVKEEAKRLFKKLDKDDSGTVSKAEAAGAIEWTNESEASRVNAVFFDRGEKGKFALSAHYN